MKIIVESAIKLSAKQQTSINQWITSTDQDVVVEYRVSPELLGGLRVVMPQKTIDLSVAARLAQLKQVIHQQFK